MAESIRDKVAIIGMGLSKWGERWDTGIFDLVSEACNEAFDDAGIDKKQIDACWTGYYQNETATTGVVISQALQLQQIPITRVENGCASGAEVIRGAALGLASKQYDLVLAVGFEKLKDVGFGGMATAGAPGMVYPMYAAEFGAAPGRYALAATAYFREVGPDQGRGQEDPGQDIGEEPSQWRPEPEGHAAPGDHRGTGDERPHNRLAAGPLRLLRGLRWRGRGGHVPHGGREEVRGQAPARLHHYQGLRHRRQPGVGQRRQLASTSPTGMRLRRRPSRPSPRRASRTPARN